MALHGKRSWIRVQGRANAALFLVARTMGADFVEPPTEQEFAGVQGRTHGCVFDLRVSPTANDHATLILEVRHFHTQQIVPLAGPGLDVPELDPDAIQRAIDDACATLATNQ
jgi:hypothetical protein